MRRLLLLAGTVSAMLALCLLPGAAQAQALITFVSGGGEDTNPCSRASPCQSWAGAFGKTAVGGEIDAIDGGSYGSLTITHAITIDGGGQGALIVGFDGFNGITVSAGASDVVTLRNLRINGFGQSNLQGLNGILINSAGTVHIENCNIYGFPKNGIVAKTSAAFTKLFINDTTISDNLNGVQFGPTAGNFSATFERVRVHNNSNAGIFLNPAGGEAALALSRSALTVNGTGLLVEPNGFAVLNDTEIAGNNTGVSIVGSGQVTSFGNNPILDVTTGPAFIKAPLK